MGQSTWGCLRILSSIMKVLALILLVSAVSAKNIRIQLLAPPTELEHGYCKGSPEPADLDKLSIDPFPIMIGNGLTETLELQVTLKEEIAKGAQVHLDAKLEGIIPIPIPCVEINGLHIGSCDYDADHLLNLADPILCPDHFPEGQACALPLLPGLYGGGDPLVIGPLDDIPDAILPFLKGVIYAEATLTSAAGDKLACIWVRAAVDHS